MEADHIHLRTLDSKLIAIARDPATYKGKRPLPDGTASDIRWVPTRDGVALGIRDCSACHTRYLEDGTSIPGAPRDSVIGSASAVGLIGPMQTAKRVVNASAPFHMGPQPFGEWLYQAWGVPWRRERCQRAAENHDGAGIRSPPRRRFSAAGATLAGMEVSFSRQRSRI